MRSRVRREEVETGIGEKEITDWRKMYKVIGENEITEGQKGLLLTRAVHMNLRPLVSLTAFRRQGV